jgi:hypothetical protein
MMRSAFFHEDDYRLIELLPLQNWPHCVAELGDVRLSSEENADPNGLGWRDMHQITSAKIALSTSRIRRAELAVVLAAHFPQFEHVESGTFSYPKQCTETYAFGSSTSIAVFFDSDSSEIVEHIWFLFRPQNEHQCIEMANALASVSKIRELLLVDWAWRALFRLDERKRLTAYLLERGRILEKPPK